MQSSIRTVISLVLLSSMLASYHADSSTKRRRDGLMNLYPFPRVGRASRNTWQVPLNDYFLDYEPKAENRQVYAFPRVSRSEMSLLRDSLRDFHAVPVKRTESPGMWFGPRLGRSLRSEEDEITIQGEGDGRSEPEQIESFHDSRDKRQAKLM